LLQQLLFHKKKNHCRVVLKYADVNMFYFLTQAALYNADWALEVSPRVVQWIKTPVNTLLLKSCFNIADKHLSLLFLEKLVELNPECIDMAVHFETVRMLCWRSQTWRSHMWSHQGFEHWNVDQFRWMLRFIDDTSVKRSIFESLFQTYPPEVEMLLRILVLESGWDFPRELYAWVHVQKRRSTTEEIEDILHQAMGKQCNMNLLGHVSRQTFAQARASRLHEFWVDFHAAELRFFCTQFKVPQEHVRARLVHEIGQERWDCVAVLAPFYRSKSLDIKYQKLSSKKAYFRATSILLYHGIHLEWSLINVDTFSLDIAHLRESYTRIFTRQKWLAFFYFSTSHPLLEKGDRT
jgi:hypothetical protein